MYDTIDIFSIINDVTMILPYVLECKANAIEYNNIKVWREGSIVKAEIKTN